MKRMRDLFVDGLLLALPLIVIVYLLGKTIGLLVKLLAPLARLVPQGGWFAIAVVDIASVTILFLALVTLGAFARSAAGRWLAEAMERVVLRKIPGFLLFKSIASGFTSEERETGLKPALVRFDDNTALGFVVETGAAADAMVTVFMPSAPTPAAGNVVLVPSSRITLLDVPMSHAIGTVTRLGLGLQQLIPADSKREA